MSNITAINGNFSNAIIDQYEGEIFYEINENINGTGYTKSVLKYNLINNKHIPIDFIVNDKDTRLKVLAGLIDTDGNVRAIGREIRICQGPTNYRIIDDACYLATSLGFSCGVKEGRSQ